MIVLPDDAIELTVAMSEMIRVRQERDGLVLGWRSSRRWCRNMANLML